MANEFSVAAKTKSVVALRAAISAVAPNDGVGIGSFDDRATWRIDFTSEATDQQRAAAAGVLAAFDMNATLAALTVAEARIICSRLQLKLELRSRPALGGGDLLAATQAVAAASPNPLAPLYWADATEFASDSAVIIALCAAVGIDTPTRLDIFAKAKLRVV